jgi:hypothetical protein
VARDKLKKKIATYKEGVALRKKEVEQAKMAFAKDVAELSKLKNEEKILKGLVEQLKGVVFLHVVLLYFKSARLVEEDLSIVNIDRLIYLTTPACFCTFLHVWG